MAIGRVNFKFIPIADDERVCSQDMTFYCANVSEIATLAMRVAREHGILIENFSHH